MRRAAVLLPLLLIAGCNKEPDFEERYDKATAEIEARAKAMDAEIAEADRAARAAGEALPNPPPAVNPPTPSGN